VEFYLSDAVDTDDLCKLGIGIKRTDQGLSFVMRTHMEEDDLKLYVASCRKVQRLDGNMDRRPLWVRGGRTGKFYSVDQILAGEHDAELGETLKKGVVERIEDGKCHTCRKTANDPGSRICF
jgi:hypothetical protein